MPVKWTAENDQRLLLLIIDSVTVDKDKVASQWSQKFGGGSAEVPTARAITERVAKLRKDAGLGPKSGSTPAKGTTTPSVKRSTPFKDPTSSAKRAKTTGTPSKNKRQDIRDGDEKDDESDMDVVPDVKAIKLDGGGGSRRSLARSSKPPGKIYKDGVDSEKDDLEDGVGGSNVVNSECSAFGLGLDGASSFGVASPDNFTARLDGRELGLRNCQDFSANGKVSANQEKSKRSMLAFDDVGDNSDGSDWKPEL